MVSKTIKSLHISQVNTIIEQLWNRKSKFDSRGLIDVKEVYRAVRAAYHVQGLMDDAVLKGTINFMVACGYLKFERVGRNGLVFFVNFKGVVRDENGRVIGVRW